MTEAFDRDVWEQLASDPAADGLVRRRVLPALHHDLFVGEVRPSRERVLLMQIGGRHIGLPARRASSNGLKVEVDDSDPDLVNIRLTSTSPADASLFAEVANDVVTTLLTNPDDGAAARVLNRVIAWQSFFATKRESFSPERAAGLYSELYVLRETFIPTLGSDAAVTAWCGPDPAVQDFQVASLAMEVKSFRGTGPGRLVISSERQLDLVGMEQLFLAYLRLDQRQDGPGSTLLDLVSDIRNRLTDSASALALYEERLLSYGWQDSFAEYRCERYQVRANEAFRVADDFPRIVPESLPNGVGLVSYSVDRSAIETFLIPWAYVEAALLEMQ